MHVPLQLNAGTVVFGAYSVKVLFEELVCHIPLHVPLLSRPLFGLLSSSTILLDCLLVFCYDFSKIHCAVEATCLLSCKL